MKTAQTANNRGSIKSTLKKKLQNMNKNYGKVSNIKPSIISWQME